MPYPDNFDGAACTRSQTSDSADDETDYLGALHKIEDAARELRLSKQPEARRAREKLDEAYALIEPLA